MFAKTEPVTDLLTHFRGIAGLVDIEVSRQISTRIPVGAIASIEVICSQGGMSKAQVYSRVIEAGLRSFRMALEPAELEAFNAATSVALHALTVPDESSVVLEAVEG